MDYFAVDLSENIGRTPEGYVICKDAVIGRTGYQTYKVSQLDQGQLRTLGLTDRFSDPDEDVQVYRSPEQVFSQESIASFEGKPVTDLHPDKFVTAKNHADLQRGHVQNVRRGEEPLSDGNFPLLADLHITDPDLADDVMNRRKRELSCGYGCSLAWDGNQLSQENNIGNHVAVVPKARAGAEVRINDSADIPQSKKEPMSIFKHIMGLGLQAYAKDAEPEKLADAVKECRTADEEKSEPKDEPKKDESKAEDADPLAEIKDSLKSICDRLDALEKPEEEKAEDADEESEQSEEEEAEDEEEPEGKAEDAFIGPTVSESDFIKTLKPLVARTKDADIKAEFNKLISKASDSRRGGSPKGAYGAVKSAAGKSASVLDSKDAGLSYTEKLQARAKEAFEAPSKKEGK